MQYTYSYLNTLSLLEALENFKSSLSLKDKILMLAPMAGFSDLPFRRVVKNFGVDISVSEMISAHALAYSNDKTLKMALKNANENLFAIQISGSKEDILLKALDNLNALEEKGSIDYNILDFNCGCPAPKVTSNGNGSALLKDLDKFVKITNLLARNTNKIFSVKVRLGFDTKIPLELACALNQSGASYCVVHARSKKDAYKKDRIDYDSLALMKENLKIPLIANGEIGSLQEYKEVIKHTHADGAMIGRAALRSPWIFWQIKNNTSSTPSMLKKRLILDHLQYMYEFYKDRGVIMFRKNLHAYTKGHRFASEFRNAINSLSNYEDAIRRIEEFFLQEELYLQQELALQKEDLMQEGLFLKKELNTRDLDGIKDSINISSTCISPNLNNKSI